MKNIHNVILAILIIISFTFFVFKIPRNSPLSVDGKIEKANKIDYVNHLVKAASKKIAQNKLGAAKAFLHQALTIDPSNRLAKKLYDQIPIVFNTSLCTISIENEKLNLEKAKIDVNNHYDDGVTHLANGKYDLAEESFTKAFEITRFVPELSKSNLKKKAQAKLKETKRKKRFANYLKIFVIFSTVFLCIVLLFYLCYKALSQVV